jgi:hypothetical protein
LGSSQERKPPAALRKQNGWYHHEVDEPVQPGLGASIEELDSSAVGFDNPLYKQA